MSPRGMQWWYSPFPNRSAAFALLLLRATAGLPQHPSLLILSAGHLGLACHGLMGLLGILLLLGAWTPIVATLLAMTLLSCDLISGAADSTVWIRTVIAFSIALLGPGAWSVDARRYALRPIHIDTLKS